MTDTTLPRPLVPAEVNLSDFATMPLDVKQLRDSRFAAEVDAEAFRAGVLLWCAAWHQTPAGSLPDDDRALAALSGLGRRWRRWKEAALTGFILCSDGRYYHPRLAERALRVWEAKQVILRREIRRLEITSEQWAELRAAAFARDHYRCRYCGAQGVRFEADHIVPVARGGPSVLDNLATACRPCNRSKGCKPIDEWRAYR